GFRLPWSTDRAASREASAVPVDELDAAAPVADVDDGAAAALEPGDTSPPDAAGDGVPGQEEEAVTILAPDAGPTLAQADHPAPASKRAVAPDPPAAGEPALAAAPSGAAPQRRPTKFLADLTRAMQAAAEQARTATLDQFRGEGTTVIEQIHARSATGATELRRHADDDVAAIKDWSKAEIVRVRDETERRIGARREQLEGQLGRHAAIVEHEIDKIRGRIASFETEMGKFFDDLVGEEDPAVFAARAVSLPEPPTFEDLDNDAMTALLREPGLGVPEPVIEEAVEAVLEPAGDAVVGVVADDPQGTHNAVAEDAPLDREAAMAAIQAAAEAAAALEAAELTADAAAAQMTDAAVEVAAEGAPDVSAPDPSAPAAADDEIDPRLAMLGLTPNFAAAEIAAVEMAAAEVDGMPEIGGDALAARLSGLVPGDEPEAAEAAVTTRVVVTGLVSVASIASFKRHMGRLVGVGHVGVSSGPDAEFVFVVSHDPATSLRDLIPTLPGFAARVVGVGDGVIQVSAQDPQD
ncbi:MAG TPA: hypothetical protein VER83_08010, partial [Candidatus Nanopelagicales bacterium]|nr:hypothetical protein [Candidatus Nanopelagicales bacterium]